MNWQDILLVIVAGLVLFALVDVAFVAWRWWVTRDR